MDHNRSEIEVVLPTPRWKKLLRQNSEKIGSLAEDVVLPINQRSGQRTYIPEVIVLRDVEAQSSNMSTMVVEQSAQKLSKHFPIFMITISIIQVSLSNRRRDDNMLLTLGYDPQRRHEIWRFVTIMFVHIGLIHLWSNVIFQLILGIPLEIVHNWNRIAVIYVSSVVGGSLFISVLSPRTYAAGASAGVYGLLFSHLSTIILNWSEMDRKCCRLFWLLSYIFFDIGFTIFMEMREDEVDSDTSHAGHLGGAVTGFLVSILVLKNFRSHPWEEQMKKICYRILIVLGVIMLVVNVLAWGLYLPEEWNFNYGKSYDIFIKKFIIESADDSELHKLCIEDSECKSMLDQFKFNATISDKPLH